MAKKKAVVSFSESDFDLDFVSKQTGKEKFTAVFDQKLGVVAIIERKKNLLGEAEYVPVEYVQDVDVDIEALVKAKNG